MKPQARTLRVCLLALSLLLVGPPPSGGAQPAALPPVGLPTGAHIPYDPYVRSATLPAYPYNGLRPSRARAASPAKPDGVDLDVTYISRTPAYKRYDVCYADGKPFLCPGTEGEQRWPSNGELVTFTAHFANKGTVASGTFTFKWYVDGVEKASGTHGGLAPGETGSATYQWPWAHTLSGERLVGAHSIRFAVDPGNAIAEAYESNNTLEDRTDALSLFLVVTPALYAALETPADPKWPFSAEDWLQKQVKAMNDAFVRSVYSATCPSGVLERVRLDRIVVADSEPLNDRSADGGFFLSADDRFGNAYYDPVADVSGSLLHELSHQLGIVDLYNLDVPLEVPQVLDRQGRPVQIEYYPGGMQPGLMHNPGIVPPLYEEHSAAALNTNKGYRRGYYGEYLYDLPGQTILEVTDNAGEAAYGVTVNLYQRAPGPNKYGSRFGTFAAPPTLSGVTDANGALPLANRSVGMPVVTRTGHTLVDNPFAVVDVGAKNDEFLVELTKGTHQEYLWLDITAFNLARWHGGTTSAVLRIASHAPPDGAPSAPAGLSGLLEGGQVKLSWPASALSVAHTFNVYRARGPVFAFLRVASGLSAGSFAEPYTYDSAAAIYTVTAVDAEGRESGFGDAFYALRLVNPSAVAVDGQNGRIVLDPQNGYALLYQTPEGTFADTRGSYDTHLEYSRYLSVDAQGRLVIAHPADYYSGRHSVRVLDAEGNEVLEFGDTGSGPGQLNAPAGVATWGAPSTFRFLVADSGNNRLQAFDASGNFVAAYGGPGSGAGQFADPRGLAVDGAGRVYVADAGNNRLQVLTFDGATFAHLCDITAAFSAPTGVDAEVPDRLVVADTNNGLVKVLDTAGNLLATYDGPTDGRVGPFNEPRGVAVDRAGNIVVADTGNRRVVSILAHLAGWRLFLPLVTR